MNNEKIHALSEAIFLCHKQSPNESSSPPPTEDEFCALLEGKLDFKRKNEVYDYLNNNEELFQQWIDLIEMDSAQISTQKRSKKQKKSILDWISLHKFGFAISNLTLVCIVVIVITRYEAHLPIELAKNPPTTLQTASPLSSKTSNYKFRRELDRYQRSCLQLKYASTEKREAILTDVRNHAREMISIAKRHSITENNLPHNWLEFVNAHNNKKQLCQMKISYD